MVLKTVEIGLEVKKRRQEEVIKKIKELYPDLKIIKEDREVRVRGDLSNYKRRSMIMWILSGGRHGKNIHAS